VRILITGGNGFLGRRVAALALARRQQVRLLGLGAVGELLATDAADRPLPPQRRAAARSRPLSLAPPSR